MGWPVIGETLDFLNDANFHDSRSVSSNCSFLCSRQACRLHNPAAHSSAGLPALRCCRKAKHGNIYKTNYLGRNTVTVEEADEVCPRLCKILNELPHEPSLC